MEISINPRIAIAGSVNSSKKVLEKMIEHNMNVVSVYGLAPEFSKKVSGFQDLKPVAEHAGLRFKYFEKINSEWIVDELKSLEVDLFFVIGLSQLIDEELINTPKFGCIGYHPTKLPKGRGRGAIAWTVLGKVESAATFFKIDSGADSGEIIFSEPVNLNGTEYAQDVIDKLMIAISTGLDSFLPKLKKGQMSLISQNEDVASYLEIRRPNDGYIDWLSPAKDIQSLIRAVSKPLPGAFTFFQDNKIYIWKADFLYDYNIQGVVGRVLKVDEIGFYVQAGVGVVHVTDFSIVPNDAYSPKVGDKLGLDALELLRQIKELKNKIN